MNETLGSTHSEPNEETSGHTLGPWFFVEGATGFSILPDGRRNPRSLAVTTGDSPEDRGNAQLIATAPDLLRVLKLLVNPCRTAAQDHKTYGDALRIIAKAQGVPIPESTVNYPFVGKE